MKILNQYILSVSTLVCLLSSQKAFGEFVGPPKPSRLIKCEVQNTNTSTYSRLQEIKENGSPQPMKPITHYNPQPLPYAHAGYNQELLAEPYEEQFWESYTCEQTCLPDPRFAFAFIPNIQYTGGRGLSYDGGYAGIEGFLAMFDQWNYQYPFFDVQLNRINNGDYASNIGIGWRSFCSNFEQMIGVNLYYDRREVKNHTLQQMSFGVEFLGKCLDIRGNGYWPVGKKLALFDPLFYAYPDSDYVATGSEYRGTMWGVDVEIGKGFCLCNWLSAYVAAGPYFYGSECCQSLVGGRGRLELWVCNRFRFEGSVLHDRIFGTNVQGSVYLYLPFPTCIRDCWLCLFPPVIRNPIMVLEELCCWERVFQSP